MIAFIRHRGHEFDGLYLVEADGSNLRRLDRGTLGMFEPAWSPDGSTLVAVGRSRDWADPADFHGQLNLLSLDGTRTRITEDRAGKLRPTWSPDGEIVFERAVGRSGWHVFAIHP